MGLKFIDLFAGLGGFHLALQRLGHECVFASELKEDLQRLYEINFGGGVIHGDILSFEPKDIPAHDILCAGFPCQPFSQAGKREGFKDKKERGNFFFTICNIIGLSTYSLRTSPISMATTTVIPCASSSANCANSNMR